MALMKSTTCYLNTSLKKSIFSRGFKPGPVFSPSISMYRLLGSNLFQRGFYQTLSNYGLQQLL